MDSKLIKTWSKLSKDDKLSIFEEAGEKAGLPATAIEKDWYVTLALSLVFSGKFAKHLVFKGGTSLSKGWNLIERFSEDIDLAIDREFLGFEGKMTKSRIERLRKTSCAFVSGDFADAVSEKINEQDIGLTLNVPDFNLSNTDPVTLELHYEPLTDKTSYLKPRILIEVGARSLMEPCTERTICSIAGKNFANRDFADQPISIPTVLPKRTFLEKVFLLHEEFQKPTEHIKVNRLSRHFYDLDKLATTYHSREAVKDMKLYQSIIEHRRLFNPVKKIDYANHHPDKINLIPPTEVIKDWEADYSIMRESMIYGNSKNFQELLVGMKKLMKRFRSTA